MAEADSSGLRPGCEAVKASMTDNKKIADLQRDIKDQHSKQNTTTDFGIKVHDLDHWLKNVHPENNRVGSHYLEDQIARERVSARRFIQCVLLRYLPDSQIRS